jgi:carboxypeptidase C (cathepsin A)
MRLAPGILLAALLLPGLAAGQPRRAGPQAMPASAATPAPNVTGQSVTHQAITVGGASIGFAAVVEMPPLEGANGHPEAELMTTAFLRDGDAPQARPVTFVFNGGPGDSSAWLDLGALGPWRIAMDGDAARPSADVAPVDNAETWLPFTDLVFIDPPGTGYARLLADTPEVRKRVWSTSGDIDAIAETIRRWLALHRRMASPKYVLGESYGGIRAPRVVRELAETKGVGVRGLVLISPVMDYGRSQVFDPLSWVWALPGEVAAVRARKGPVTEADLADVEAYASGEYLAGLLRGPNDSAAVEQRVARMEALTGLDPALLRARRGLVSEYEFTREIARAQGRVASLYDLTVTKPDAWPASPFGQNPDPMTVALRAPAVSAMTDVYARRLGWQSDTPYLIDNADVRRQWDFGPARAPAQSYAALRTDLAADPSLRVLVAHGLFDVITPYFRTKVMLRQIEAQAGGGRVRLLVLPGGHMFYSRDESRAALRDAARELYAE